MALNFSEWHFHKIGWVGAEGFIDFYSKRRRVGGGNVKSLELREMPRHLLGRQVKSVKKSELGQKSCSEGKWVCCQNGSSSAGGVLVWRRRRGKSLEICSERHGGSRLTVETQTQRPVDCGAPRTTLLPAPPPQPAPWLRLSHDGWKTTWSQDGLGVKPVDRHASSR